MSSANSSAQERLPPARPERITRYRIGSLHIDLAARTLTRDGETLGVQPKAFDLVAYLLTHRERAVGRDELISGVWGKVDISDAALAQAVRVARKALGDSGNRQEMIRTLFGFGYQWVAAVGEPANETDAARAADVAPVPLPVPAHAPSRPNAFSFLRNRRLRVVLLVLLFALATCGGFAVASVLSMIVGNLGGT
ncbi:MAG TPA: winged helix-turn-helix domain-containing protein [Dokdonella sp.]|nr:winged helix-turn-helix domain-containing protein [Dokdonella sp.]